MIVEIKRKEGESLNAFLYRFNKKIKQSGLVREVKKRHFRVRPPNKRARRLSALYRAEKSKEVARLKKLGRLPSV